MRVILDTNILVSSLRSRRGASFRLISLIPSESFKPCLSVPLYIEYQDALLRSGKVSGFTNKEIKSFLRYICGQCHHQEIFYLWRPYLKDPKDDMVLELAVASESGYIITHNVRDFRGTEHFGIEPITPKDLLEKIGEI